MTEADDDSYDRGWKAGYQAALQSSPQTAELEPYPELVQLRNTLKHMLALFDDEGNLICTGSELQQAIWSGYGALRDTKPSYALPAKRAVAAPSPWLEFRRKSPAEK